MNFFLLKHENFVKLDLYGVNYAKYSVDFIIYCDYFGYSIWYFFTSSINFANI
jgi:hypothetical protein